MLIVGVISSVFKISTSVLRDGLSLSMGLSQVALQRMNMVMCIVYAEVLIVAVILLTI